MAVARRLRKKTKITRNDEANGNCQGHLNVVDRGFNCLGPVAGDGELNAWRQGRRERRQPLLYAFDRLDDVETGLFVDIDNDRALVLQPSGLFGVFCGVDCGPDIGDADRRAVLIGDDKVFVRVGVKDLVGGVKDDRPVRAVEIALGSIHGRGAEHRPDVFEAQPQLGDLIRVDLHTNRGLLLTMEIDQPDPGNLRDLSGDEVVGIAVDFRQRQSIRGQRQ
jgi:hypothetical protein